MRSDDWRSHVVSINPACRWCVDVGCVVYNTTKRFGRNISRKLLVRTQWIKFNINTEVHLFVIYILRVWLIHGRWNTLKQCIRKFSSLEEWCIMEYDAVSTCKFLLPLRRTEMPSSSGICSPKRDRQDEGSVFLQRSTAICYSTQRIMPEHPNHQHRLCEKIEWRKK